MRTKHDLKLCKTSRNPTHRNLAINSATDYVFGKPNRPQTPLNQLITNDYGMKGEAEMKERYEALKTSVSL